MPDYLPEVPKDPFSGKELVYRVTPTGYLLYSVGVDGKDDGGKSCGPTGLEEPGDILLDDPPSPPGPGEDARIVAGCGAGVAIAIAVPGGRPATPNVGGTPAPQSQESST